MKRALFVSAGTVAGLVASLSYSPGLLDAIGAPAAGKHGPNASGKSLKVNSAFEGGSNAGQRTHKNNNGGDGDKSGAAKSATGKENPQQSGGGSATGSSGGTQANPNNAGSGSGSGSGSTSGSGPGSKPSSKPTHTSNPKPSHSPTPATPKTYVGAVASTAFGPMQVSITVLNGRITDATAIQSPSAEPRSVDIANNALPKLRSETLAAQSAQIAAVSGASYTSAGWITSLQSALAKAGL